MPIARTVLILGSLFAAGCARPVSNGSVTPVEVWRGGDDGFTARLADAIEAAFRVSPAFSMSYGKKPGTLIVTIPTNVAFEETGARVQIFFDVNYTNATDRLLGSASGTCWENELSTCAAEVVKRAEGILRIISSVSLGISILPGMGGLLLSQPAERLGLWAAAGQRLDQFGTDQLRDFASPNGMLAIRERSDVWSLVANGLVSELEVPSNPWLTEVL
jgi:hypothetical protein